MERSDRGPGIALNVAVRTAAGLDGVDVILSAWCQTCNEHAMPSSVGRCMFCDRLIYLASGGVVGDLPAPPRPKNARAGVPLIASADIVAALRAEAARLGRSPNSHEWPVGASPSYKTIFRRYGSWNAALVDAGLERIA